MQEAHQQTEVIRLRSGNWEEYAESVRALLFGELVKRMSVVSHYHSDLYHDAVWVRENVNGKTSFYWVARPNGTHMGQDRELLTHAARSESGAVFYRITLSQSERGFWTAEFEKLDPTVDQKG